MKLRTTEDRTMAGVEKVTYQRSSKLDISSLMLLVGLGTQRYNQCSMSCAEGNKKSIKHSYWKPKCEKTT
jgi:hypothetical protein